MGAKARKHKLSVLFREHEPEGDPQVLPIVIDLQIESPENLYSQKTLQ